MKPPVFYIHSPARFRQLYVPHDVEQIVDAGKSTAKNDKTLAD